MNTHKRFELADKTRSKLEDRVLGDLRDRGVAYNYEPHTIPYIIPSNYTPDLILPNFVLIEIKGYFLPEDRRKHLLLKNQYPGLDVRFVFANSNKPIRKGSKTTYAHWCQKNGFLLSDKVIPQAWVDEAPNTVNRDLLEKINGQ